MNKLMKVKFKKLNPNAVVPRYAHAGDAGLDLTATSRVFDEKGSVVYGTGLAVEIPEGYVGLLFPRSSICKKDLLQSNAVGVIDSGYRGEIMVKFKPSASFDDGGYSHANIIPKLYETGDRVAQLIIIPHPDIMPVECTQLSPSPRGDGGFGSTGR